MTGGRPRRDPRTTRPAVTLRSDGLWHATVLMGRRPDGGRIRRHVKRRTEAEAVAEVRRLETERDSGRFVWTEARERVTVEAWLVHWLDRVVRPTRKPKTYAAYASALRCHVIPILGEVPLAALTTEQIEECYAARIAGGASAHAVHSAHRTLRSALQEAVTRGRIFANPAAAAAVPRRQEVEVEPLTQEEARRVLDAAKRERNAARWSVGLALGLRQGEVLGLRWQDLDLDAGILRVRRSLQRHTWRHGCRPVDGQPGCGRKRGSDCPRRHGGGLVAVETKTRGSSRTVPLPGPLVEELRAHLASQRRERLRAGDAWGVDGWVFCDPLGGPIDPRRDWQSWKDLLARAGVRDARVHDQRHTAATLLLAQGVDVRTVMAIMGWTEMRMADRYGHAVNEALRGAADQMAGVLWADRTG